MVSAVPQLELAALATPISCDVCVCVPFSWVMKSGVDLL